MTASINSTPDSRRRHPSNGSPSSSVIDLITKNGLSNPTLEKDLLHSLRKELYERGSPVSLMESPAIQDLKKHNLGSSSDVNLAEHFFHSSSGTNLKSRVSHERTPSVVSSKVTSPKLNKRNYKKNSSHLNLSNMHGLSPSGLGIENDSYFEVHSDNNPFEVIVPEKPSEEASDRKTLVDQFYSINNTEPIKQDALKDLEHSALDSHIEIDEELTNYLLNIDTIVQENYQANDQDESKALLPIIDALRSINKNITQSNLNREIKSIDDINQLTRNLETFGNSIQQLNLALIDSSQRLTDKFQPEIKNTVNKLNDLLLTLENLEFRLSKTKGLIEECKEIISNDIFNTIEILDYVNNKFGEYSKQTRKARLKQLNISLALAVIIIGVYFGIYNN